MKKKIEGFIIITSDGQIGYDNYSYFTTNRITAIDILNEVCDDCPDLRVISATIRL